MCELREGFHSGTQRTLLPLEMEEEGTGKGVSHS